MEYMMTTLPVLEHGWLPLSCLITREYILGLHWQLLTVDVISWQCLDDPSRWIRSNQQGGNSSKVNFLGICWFDLRSLTVNSSGSGWWRWWWWWWRRGWWWWWWWRRRKRRRIRRRRRGGGGRRRRRWRRRRRGRRRRGRRRSQHFSGNWRFSSERLPHWRAEGIWQGVDCRGAGPRCSVEIHRIGFIMHSLFSREFWLMDIWCIERLVAFVDLWSASFRRKKRKRRTVLKRVTWRDHFGFAGAQSALT